MSNSREARNRRAMLQGKVKISEFLPELEQNVHPKPNIFDDLREMKHVNDSFQHDPLRDMHNMYKLRDPRDPDYRMHYDEDVEALAEDLSTPSFSGSESRSGSSTSYNSEANEKPVVPKSKVKRKLPLEMGPQGMDPIPETYCSFMKELISGIPALSGAEIEQAVPKGRARKTHMQILRKTRSHGITITMNYPVAKDVSELRLAIKNLSPDYAVFGWEGTHEMSTVHPHIHVYMHFRHAKQHSAVMKHFKNKLHWSDSVKHPEAMSKYCKGYFLEKGPDGIKTFVLKEPLCGENKFEEYGTPPAGQGQSKSYELISKAIEDGLTLAEIEELPGLGSYMFYHRDKVRAAIAVRRKPKNPDFYVIQEDSPAEMVQDVLQFLMEKYFPRSAKEFDSKEAAEEYRDHMDTMRHSLAIVTDLSQLSNYGAYEHVLYIADKWETGRDHSLWVVGNPVLYKSGYNKWERVLSKTFIIATPHYERYKKLGFRDITYTL